MFTLIFLIIFFSIGLGLLFSAIGLLFKLAVIVVAAAIIYRIYLDYKMKK